MNPLLLLRSRRRALALILGTLSWNPMAARAHVVVVANRMPEAVAVTTTAVGTKPQTTELASGECRPFFGDAPLHMRLAGAAQNYELAPDCAYYIGPGGADGAPALAAIGLGEAPDRLWPAPGANAAPPPLPDANVITVKIMVDDDERRLQRVWEPALRQRIENASNVLVAHGGPRLKVVAIGSWDSDDTQNDFVSSLTEFERETSPAPAQVAIGFTSQYVVQRGRVHMGGTRGPLHSHILIKERAANVLETERLELLVHELGHFCGASHSPEPESVMRPVLGQGLQRRAGSQVRFDPVNTLLVSMLGEEVRRRGVRKLADVTPETRRRMREIYAALEPTMPEDPASKHYLQLVDAAEAQPLVKDARRVLEQFVRIAQIEQRRLAQTPALGADHGDRLLEFYVRQSALAAKQVRRENGAKAFTLAIGYALDDEGMLASLPVSAILAQKLENDQERSTRVSALGTPTMRGRNDLAKHFFVSVHLTALMGSEAARTAGLVKELRDAQVGSGFSFRDLAADRAGVLFATNVLTGRISLDDVAKFTVADYLPPLDDLREDMDLESFTKSFGGTSDPRFLAEVSLIDGRIMALPGYSAPAAAPAP
jgi:hypothetical protein